MYKRQAVQDAINKATADAKKNGTTANGIAVTVPIQNAANAKNLTITIKAQTLDKLVTAKARRFEITTNGLPSFRFTLDTLKMLNAQSKGGDLILRVSKAAVTSAEAKAAIGTRPVYEFSLVYVTGGKEVPLSLIHILCFFIARETSGANDNKALAKSPLAIIKGTNFLAEKPNGR